MLIHPFYIPGYTKTGLVFGFSKNQSLVAVILGQNCFWIFSENNFEMSINKKHCPFHRFSA
jgi:hypothetical protein